MNSFESETQPNNASIAASLHPRRLYAVACSAGSETLLTMVRTTVGTFTENAAEETTRSHTPYYEGNPAGR